MVLVAFDPGRNVGVAFVAPDGRLLARRIVTLTEVDLLELPEDPVVLIGSGTGSKELRRRLRERGFEPQPVDETATTLAAKDLYYRDHPARGWSRLVPVGMRSPNVQLDDYAAYAIALRWLEGNAASLRQ